MQKWTTSNAEWYKLTPLEGGLLSRKIHDKTKSDFEARRTPDVHGTEKKPPQILFIERCLQLLKPGGRMAIVLPDGILGGAKIGYVPHFINSKFETVALVDCPLESFSPNTTTKVHLLVLRKRIVSVTKTGKIEVRKLEAPTIQKSL